MRKGAIFCLATLVALLAVPMMAQAPSGAVVRVAVWKVKPGMGQQFQAGVKKHNEFHVKANDPVGLETWEITSGENAGNYLRIVTRPSWAAYDTPTYDADADEADSAANVDPYMTGGPVEWWRLLADVSTGPMAGTPPAMDEVLFFHLNMGHSRDFMVLIKKVTEAAKANNWSVNYYRYVLENGGEHPTFALVIPKNKMADFDDPPVTFQAMLEKTFGRSEAEMIYKGFDKSVHCQKSETIAYRADLSYVPTKK
jgi:hypothetical protein